MDLLDQLELLSERIDPRTGRLRVARAEAEIAEALEHDVEERSVPGARMWEPLREKYRHPGMPPLQTPRDHHWPSEDEDPQVAADNQRQLVELVAAAIQAIGDGDRVVKWIRTPNKALGGRSPIQALNAGEAVEVYRVLGRIDHGIFE